MANPKTVVAIETEHSRALVIGQNATNRTNCSHKAIEAKLKMFVIGGGDLTATIWMEYFGTNAG